MTVLRALAAVMMLSCGAARAEIIDRVLAVVAGEVIMMSDVTAMREFALIATGPADDPIREVLSRLIDRALILGEVDRYAPPEPPADAVDREVQAARSRFATPQAYETALARAGIDEQHLRETVRKELRIRAYLEQRFTVAEPGEAELNRFYGAHRDRFSRDGVLLPFEAVQALVVADVKEERRQRLVTEWLAGLRRRAEILDLYLPIKKN